MISNINTFSEHMVVRVMKLIYSGLPVPFQLQEYLTAAPEPPRLQKRRSDSIAFVFVALSTQLELTHHTKKFVSKSIKKIKYMRVLNKSNITLHYSCIVCYIYCHGLFFF